MPGKRSPIKIYTRNIDWVLYVSNGYLEHEFVVKEGGNVADIKLKYGGASQLKINTDGSLAASTPMGAITEHAPVCYEQKGKEVHSKFNVLNDLVTYDVEKYSGTLIIDPALTWATYYGGASSELARQIVRDSFGNLYTTGYAGSTSGIATTGAYMTTFAGTTDAYLAKFDSTGAIKWATYYGGTQGDESMGIAIDGSGYLYITGWTSSAAGIATPGAYQVAYTDSSDVFLAKFDSIGTIKWATYYGANRVDNATSVATDASGNVYITGITKSSTGIATPGAHQPTYTGGLYDDVFLAKFDSSGARLWGTYYGGTGAETARDIATDNSGNVFIYGSTGSATGMATAGAYDATLDGIYDAFLAKFNGAGAIQWATYYGGTGNDQGNRMTIDGTGNVYITGHTTSTSDIATTGAYKTVYSGGPWDGFLAKFSNSGARLWATYYGGANNDEGQEVVMGSSTNVYVLGNTKSASGIATPSAYQETIGGIYDAFLAKFHIPALPATAGVITGPDSVCLDSAITLANIIGGGIWSSTDTSRATVSGGVVTGKTSGIDTIKYALTDGCDTIFATKTIYIKTDCTTGVEDIEPNETGITVYPNPAKDELNVATTGKICALAICNLVGQTLYSHEYDAKKIQVDISGLPAGVYIIRINGSLVRRFVKQ